VIAGDTQHDAFTSFSGAIMLQQIISHTPHWVWVLLAFLLYRGVVALADREVSFRKAMLMPLVMFGLSLQGLLSQFKWQPEVLAMALLAALVSVIWGWRATARNVWVSAAVPAGIGSMRLSVRGSWRPLAMTVSIFTIKYSVGVMQAMHPEQLRSSLIAMTLGLLYGLFAGLSLGRLLRICQLCLQAQAPSPSATT
jgi:hypothetical protein